MGLTDVTIPQYRAPGVGQYPTNVATQLPVEPLKDKEPVVGVRVRVQGKFCYVSTPKGDEIKLDQAGVFELTRACKAAFGMVTT